MSSSGGHVDVEYVLYRTAKEAALRQIDSRLDGGAFVPSGIADAIVAMLDSTGYEWQPSLEQVDHRLPDDRDKKLARFLLGQLVFTGYAQQQANAVHVLSPQRSRVLGAVGLSGRAWQASASEGAIFAEIARPCSAPRWKTPPTTSPTISTARDRTWKSCGPSRSGCCRNPLPPRWARSPVGAAAGAAAGATVEELLKQVNTRLWGWVVEGLALRSAQKLLSRSVMAEQELRGRLGSRLEQIWMTGRA
ncbi:hypothetical protein [Mycobacterium sp.]|uniref:hypothetical protein n=1 Tax=Mycobacterium sp. TaxID=1785 RepID=UPI003340ECDB